MKSDRAMDAKLNHSDLSALLAKEAGISQAKAELLTKAFFDIIIEGLEQDGSVKINSLGTFKITDVASRSSVNVNTGEKFEIKGHGKLTFVPAESLKEAVNQPFAMFEPVEVDETYSEEPEAQPVVIEEEMPAEQSPLATQVAIATAIEEEQPLEENAPVQPAASRMGNIAVEEDAGVEQEIEEHAEEPAIEDEGATETVEPLTGVETAGNEEPAAEAVESEPATVLGTADNENVAEEPAESVAPVREPVVEKVERREPVMVAVPKKKNIAAVAAPANKKGKNGSFVTLLIILVLAGIGAGCFLWNSNDSTAASETEAASIEQQKQLEKPIDAATEATVIANDAELNDTEPVVGELSEKSTPDDSIQEPGEEYAFIMVKELAETPLANITVADTTLYVATGELAMHKVAGDETLTKIALKYFGDKKLWPYIVKHNNLARPNDLCKGMEISIPRLKPAE